ncbi:MAG: hypothetical protein J0I20_04545 [Chloroflexi bacterium]|nr:hypothetical protein [Chloroflexota bacterium]OJW04368.1 MAG: hypothetical protein BGO39_11460 [Chloroflexi bacterium 54-19]
MSLFRIDLRLKPDLHGDKILAGWPEKPLNPDFLVVAAGLARFELESKVIGISEDANQPIATATDHLTSKEVNYWLPDYTGGFALNLGDAALSVKKGTKPSALARFIEEPLDLRFERVKPLEDAHGHTENLKISFRFNGDTVTETIVPENLAWAEIARSLQDFVVQFLTLNPKLGDQKDVAHLRKLVSELA